MLPTFSVGKPTLSRFILVSQHLFLFLLVYQKFVYTVIVERSVVEMSEEIGKYLRSLRKARGLTLTELSAMSGVSHPYISQIENGKFIPSPEILDKLSKPLGVTHAELMVKAGHVKYEDWFHGKVEGHDSEDYDDLFFPEMLGYPSREAYLKELLRQRNELTHVLKKEQTTYNGHQLTEQDRRRILDMLKTLFPEYADKKGE